MTHAYRVWVCACVCVRERACVCACTHTHTHENKHTHQKKEVFGNQPEQRKLSPNKKHPVHSQTAGTGNFPKPEKGKIVLHNVLYNADFSNFWPVLEVLGPKTGTSTSNCPGFSRIPLARSSIGTEAHRRHPPGGCCLEDSNRCHTLRSRGIPICRQECYNLSLHFVFAGMPHLHPVQLAPPTLLPPFSSSSAAAGALAVGVCEGRPRRKMHVPYLQKKMNLLREVATNC